MNWKIALLIVLLLFAAAATSFAHGSLIQSVSQKSPCANKGQSNVQLCNGIEVEPTEEIDTPGGPTRK